MMIAYWGWQSPMQKGETEVDEDVETKGGGALKE
jgi:hypothetical protein